MKNSKTFLFFSFLILCISGVGQNGTPRPIGFNDFQASLLSSHPLAQRAGNEKLRGEYNYQMARGAYDPSIDSQLMQKMFNGKNYYNRFNAQIKQPIFTNQYLKAGYEFGEGLYLNPELATPLAGLPFAGVEVGLMQGLVIDKRRAEVLKAKSYRNYYSAEQQVLVNELLWQSSQTYLNWVFTSRSASLYNYFSTIAKQRLNAFVEMVKVGEYAPIDTIEAAIIFQSRLLDYRSAVNDLQKSGNDLLFYMTNGQAMPATFTSDDIAPDDSLESYFNRSKTKLAALLGAETSQHPSLAKYRALNSVMETDLRLKKELRKPQINLQYNLLALPANNEFLISTNNYKWGLQVSVPLFRAAKNDYKISELNQLSAKLDLQNKAAELALKMAATKRTISIISEQITIADRNARYSRQLLEAEQLKFGSGESSLFLLATRENKWLESELKLCEYKYKFVLTVMQLVYLSGALNYELP